MRSPSSSTLALPPALTYLLSRALGDCHRPRPGHRSSAARLGGLCRDTARYLASAGASRAEIEAVLADAVVAVAPDPAVQAFLDEVTADVHASIAADRSF